MSYSSISPTALQQRLQTHPLPILLDVREPHEFNYVHLPGSLSVPLRTLPQRVHELNPEQEIVVICHHGMRSQQAANFLDSQGFLHVINLSGGIAAWAKYCDPQMPEY
jgi:rhodanese-related sulfurtransferase